MSEARAFDRPGPGTWQLDAAHTERPRARYYQGVFERLYTDGFRACMARYGALLDTIEMRFVHGFPYIAVRPLGAPPDAKGPPPKLVFKLLTHVHPAVRRRVRSATRVLEERPWREDVRDFFERIFPEAQERLLALQREDVDALTLDAALEHLARARQIADDLLGDHFRRAAAAIVPVGDFLAHTTQWTGCTKEEALSALSGSSPYSLEPMRPLDRAVAALRAHGGAERVLEDAPPEEALARLSALDGEAGGAVREWLERVSHRILTGHDVSELTGGEVPEALARTLRARLRRPEAAVERDGAESAAAALRARVPAEHQGAFDALLAEARLVHPLRDGRCVVDFWALGLLRRALLAVGRRLHDVGRLEQPEHVLDLDPSELEQVARGVGGPSPEELRARTSWRETATVRMAPERIGPAPAPPPPPEWLPAPAARVARAFGVYIEAMQGESTASSTATVVKGVAASPGRYRGRARLVLGPSDFARVAEGDVLVARLTTPTYNVLLPMLGAVVTDRGGLLSHPAIVSREYGIPGVVGAREATARIPDGVLVEVDGDAGTVRILA